jgi:hypothetical protein
MDKAQVSELMRQRRQLLHDSIVRVAHIGLELTDREFNPLEHRVSTFLLGYTSLGSIAPSFENINRS